MKRNSKAWGIFFALASASVERFSCSNASMNASAESTLSIFTPEGRASPCFSLLFQFLDCINVAGVDETSTGAIHSNEEGVDQL